MTRRGSSRPGSKRKGPPPPPPPPADPLAHLSPELRALAESKRAADEWAAREEALERQGTAAAARAEAVRKKAAALGAEISAEGLAAVAAAEAEAAACAAGAKPIPLDVLILTLPGYDPRVQAGDCWFDAAAAQKAVDFYAECLTHIEGEWAGQRFVLRPWQRAVVANIFGWKRPDGLRRYRELFLEVPRKNGKTPLAAGIVLYLLCVDDEPGAQIYSAAGDKGQAALLFRHAAGMVEAEPALSKRVIPYYAGKSLEYRAAGSFYQALSKEAKTKHGFNSHGVVVDELHVQPNAHLLDTLTSSTGTRRQPLIVMITTADFVRPSICNEKEAYAEKVAANVVQDPELLPVIYRALKDAPWDAEATWRAANPNYGVSIKPDEIAREARKARVNPRARNEFIRLRLCGKTQAEVAWIPADLWALCGIPAIEFADVEAWIKELGLDGQPCRAAIDLGKIKDLSALVLFFPEQAALLPWFWAPKATAEEREQTEGVSYTAWASDGFIELVPGRKVNFDVVRAKVTELGQRFNIESVAFDRWGATQLMEDLEGDGFEVFPFGQGYKDMSGACRRFEELWLEEDPDKRLKHGGHPVLAWNASNVMVETDPAGNIKPSKKKSTERIDGIVASVMAIGSSVAGGRGAYGDGKGFRSV